MNIEDLGMPAEHWQIVAGYAIESRRVICIRGGKHAAVRWIREGLPGKPLNLSNIKVHEVHGLLIAANEADRTLALEGGHLVLVERDGRLVATGRDGEQSVNLKSDWAHPGLVLDATLKLPFTSDYDLAAIIDLQARQIGGTFGMEEGFATNAGDTNALTEEARRILNQMLGSRRFVHGAQAQLKQYDKDTKAFGVLANKDNEKILVFAPRETGSVAAATARQQTFRVLDCPTRETSGDALYRLLREYLPEIVAAESATVH